MTRTSAFRGSWDEARAKLIDVRPRTGQVFSRRAGIVRETAGLRGEVFGRDALERLSPAWEDLCCRAVEDNVYYAPRYARALLESVDKDKNVGLAVVWDKGRLVALLPFIRARLRVPIVSAKAWKTDYTYSCTPLLDRTRSAEAAAALVDLLTSIHAGEWMIPTVNVKSEACQALLSAITSRGAPWVFSNSFSRASLHPGLTFEEHLARHVSSNRRKGLARNRRRLEEIGGVVFETHLGGEGLQQALSAFLRIEAEGWKGKRGTALGCAPETQRFALAAFTGNEAESICRADVLKLNGTAIAVSLIALSGRTGFAVKTAYDETYRTYSPGLLVELEVIRRFLSERWADRLDAATAGSHVIDSLWPGRTEVADLLFSAAPVGAPLRLSTLRMSREIRQGIRGAAKRMLEQVQSKLARGRAGP